MALAAKWPARIKSLNNMANLVFHTAILQFSFIHEKKYSIFYNKCLLTLTYHYYSSSFLKVSFTKLTISFTSEISIFKMEAISWKLNFPKTYKSTTFEAFNGRV